MSRASQSAWRASVAPPAGQGQISLIGRTDTPAGLRDAAMLGNLAADDAAAVPAEAVVWAATAGSADALGFDSGRIEAGAMRC